ncbi:MAG TPA: anthranilate synthase component I family protein [Oculatellaceae cyanobacterium]
MNLSVDNKGNSPAKESASQDAAPAAKRTPFAKSFSADLGTPVSLFYKLSRSEEFSFLFESTEGDARLARYSFLSTDPCLTVKFDKGRVEVRERGENASSEPLDNPISYLRERLEAFSQTMAAVVNGADNTGTFADFVKTHENLPFLGGFVGYMGYGACGYTEKIPQQDVDIVSVPDGYYGLYDAVVIFDHQFRRVTVVSLRSQEHVDSLVNMILSTDGLQPLPIDHSKLSKKEIFEGVSTSVEKSAYIDSVNRAKEFVKEGQAFQIVVAQRFSLPTTASPIDVYRMLQATNPSPYAYFLKFPEFVYLGSSPETFVQSHNGELMLRAIAGTRKRGLDAAHDLLLQEELKSDEKEMAEHRMLVDLGRNDLGRVSVPGTIKVGELACLTKYTHVMHLETEIRGQLSSDANIFEAFQSCFPAGTVSGAPKIRAMQLLQQLEPERRGIYSGAVGYFDWRGHMDGAIAIRSALIKDGTAHVNAGGGIVYDSEPELEYEESRNKAMSVLQAIKLAERSAVTP